MKAKLFYKLFALFTFVANAFYFCLPVSATSFSMTASATQVAPGASFTISVGGDCIGRVNLKATGGTISQSAVWVEENRQIVTITAGNSGTITVTATPDSGFSDSDGEEYRPGSRTVSVKIVAPAQTTTPQPSTNTSTSSSTTSKPQSTSKPQTTTSTTKPTTTANQNKEPEETKAPEASPSEDSTEDEANTEDIQETEDNIEEEIIETTSSSCPENDSSFAWILVGILTVILCGVTTALVCVLVTYKAPEQQPTKKGTKHEKSH